MDFVMFLLAVLDAISRILAVNTYFANLLGSIAMMIMTFLGMPM